MTKVFVVVDVGCIECHLETIVLGVYATREAAKNRADEQEKAFPTFRDGGQHCVEIHETDGVL